MKRESLSNAPRPAAAALRCRRLTAWLAAAWLLALSPAAAQTPPPPGVPGAAPPPGAEGPIVEDIRFVGNRIYDESEIRSEINTYPGRPFDQLAVEQDVRNLLASGKFFDVKVRNAPGAAPGSVIVIYEVVEYPRVQYVRFVGNEKIRSRTLGKQADIKAGDSADIANVRRAKEKLEAYYQTKGFNKASVSIREGLQPTDKGVVFMIQEGPSEKVWSVDFIGNEIASDARLMTQIQSKPPIAKHLMGGFSGFVDRKKIDEDIDRLTAYYRSLGFFGAKISRELQQEEDGRWTNITFVIHEGPRYRVRNISIAGHKVFRTEQLESLVELKNDEFYDQTKMNKDVSALSDAYGSQGFVFADVKASPRLLEPGSMDLVYEIDEGKRYRVGRINVNIIGDTPHTSHAPVYNRISLRPGDIVDIREIRDSERRLQASSIFNTDPSQGPRPKISFKKRDSLDNVAEERNETVRGQSPDAPLQPGEVSLVLYPDPTPVGPLPDPQPYAAPQFEQPSVYRPSSPAPVQHHAPAAEQEFSSYRLPVHGPQPFGAPESPRTPPAYHPPVDTSWRRY